MNIQQGLEGIGEEIRKQGLTGKVVVKLEPSLPGFEGYRCSFQSGESYMAQWNTSGSLDECYQSACTAIRRYAHATVISKPEEQIWL